MIVYNLLYFLLINLIDLIMKLNFKIKMLNFRKRFEEKNGN